MRWYQIIGVIILLALAAFVYNFAKENQTRTTPLTPAPVTDEKGMISVTFPTKEAVVTSPLIVTGQARGNWYFEASFPLVLVNWDGLIIAEGYAQAKGDWMTTEYVPFEGTLTFTNPAGEQDFTHRGALILKKDNPSGLPQNDAALEIPIKFR